MKFKCLLEFFTKAHHFNAHAQKWENVFPSVRFFRVEQLGSHWIDFDEILYLRFLTVSRTRFVMTLYAHCLSCGFCLEPNEVMQPSSIFTVLRPVPRICKQTPVKDESVLRRQFKETNILKLIKRGCEFESCSMHESMRMICVLCM
jgi:hypothetical protein